MRTKLEIQFCTFECVFVLLNCGCSFHSEKRIHVGTVAEVKTICVVLEPEAKQSLILGASPR